MPTMVRCSNPTCGHTAKVADDLRGRSVSCPQCGQPIKVPQLVGFTGFRHLPTTFGRYRVERKLGTGGMGTVYLATDLALERTVALKLPLLQGADVAKRTERFFREARSAAKLQHPGLCPLYDVGTQEGQPFFTMPYLEGRALAAEINPEQPWAEEPAVALVVQMAEALQSAHAQQIIHRDLKPANVMLTSAGPVVFDFGLAKQLQVDDQMTQAGAQLGTPNYMAPEQIHGHVEQISPATDVYALCVFLFELLTGRPPYFGGRPEVVFARALRAPIPDLTQLRPDVDARLAAVIERGLAKVPTERWATAGELATALRMYRNAAPVERAITILLDAPPTDAAQWWQGVERQVDEQPGVRQALVGTVPRPVAVPTVAEETPAPRVEITDAEIDAVVRAERDQSASATAVPTTGPKPNSRHLPVYPITRSRSKVQFKKNSWTQTIREEFFAICVIWPVMVGGLLLLNVMHHQVLCLAFVSMPILFLASLMLNAYKLVWHKKAIDHSAVTTPHYGETVTSIAFSPKGDYLAVASATWTVFNNVSDASLDVLHCLPRIGAKAEVFVFHPNGMYAVIAYADSTLRYWNLANYQQIATFSGHTDVATSVAFSPDGQYIASGSVDRTLRLWDVAQRELVVVLGKHSDSITSVAFSLDGQYVVTGSNDHTIKLWNITTRQKWRTLTGHTDSVTGVAFSPDGKYLVSSSWDRTVRLWEVNQPDAVAVWRGHTNDVHCVAFSPDGRYVVSGGADKTLKLWDVVTHENALTLTGHTGSVDTVAYSPDGLYLASGGADCTVKLWEVARLLLERNQIATFGR